MAIELTREQDRAVRDRGGPLLVSAAAGSGKTRVLVERLMDYVRSGEDIDRFLVITFTNAAAAQLRDRIAQALHGLLSQSPGDAHLRRNATLVYKAQICTIDAFCLDFLRQCGAGAGLEPDFRLCDEAESRDLGRQAMEAVLERRYQGIAADPGFEQLVDELAGDRDDQTLEDVISDSYRRIQSHPDPMAWLARRRADYALPPGALPEDTPWGRALLDDAGELAAYWREKLTELLDELGFDEILYANFAPSLQGAVGQLRALETAAAQGWDAVRACLPVEFTRLGAKRGGDGGLKSRARALRDLCKRQTAKLADAFAPTAAQAMDDLRAVAPAMETLLAVTGEYGRELDALKRRRRVIDFSDGEHLTARLLSGPDGVPTALAAEWGARYREIMVDEYQDTNAVQNVIFDALSARGNLFMVGDVKQSIYRFRLADPGIFLEKYSRFAPQEKALPGQGRTVLLSENFRSRPEVLEATNFLFRNLMTRAAGELDYTDREALRPGRTDFLPDERCRAELNCVDLSDLPEEEDGAGPDKDLIEARAAAARIKRLLGEGLTVGERPLEPGDIVILLRSPGPVQETYTRALSEAGIPWQAEESGDFFGTTEVSVALSYLQIIDNPRQDVPLLSVLRSPAADFTPDDLALLRGESGGALYDCLTAAAGRGDEKCAAFLALLTQLREESAEESCQRLLWRLYERTDLLAAFSAMPDGQRRRRNLLALYDAACRFETAGHRGLFGFLRHIARMMDTGVNPPVQPGGGSGVRILSIHRSKGLEFPVVLLCGLERQFNEGDARQTILFHEKLGLGPRHTDRARLLRYSTIARDAVAMRLRRQLRAEELRLLYVAMTRAEQKLIMFAAVNAGGSGESLEALAASAQCPPPPRQVMTARSMAAWVLQCALCRPESAPLWDGLACDRAPIPAQLGPRWDMALLPAGDYREAPRPEQKPTQEAAQSGDETRCETLLARYRWRYPYAGSVDMPSKLTATQLKGREKDEEAAQDAQALLRPRRERQQRRPVLEGERPLTAAERGTALHMAMQYLDYAKAGTPEGIEEEITRLVAGQFITPAQGEAVDIDAIAALFASPLGQRLRQAQMLEREYKFSLLVPASDYYPQAAAGEELLLQGVVDCFFREADGTVTVVDFKTDRVTADTVAQRAEHYRPQLEAYSRALAETTGLAVGRRILWFFALGQAVEW